jgi:hypothetical protein
MIRLLTEADKQDVLTYLYKASEFNIFPIGDIEAFGFNEPFQTVYGEFDDKNNYLSILLFYRENVIYYSHLNVFNEEYVTILNKHEYRFMSGKESLMELVYPFLTNFNKSSMYFCSINTLKDDVIFPDSITELSTERDFDQLYELLIEIEEFSVQKQNKVNFISNKIKSLEMSKTVGIYKDDKLIATAATTAETTQSAMVVGVATRKGYRNKGYGSSLVLYLANHFIVHKQKSLSLFYDNPKAGSIYHKIGFVDIGKWMMLNEND